jgi:hypothetical protein
MRWKTLANWHAAEFEQPEDRYAYAARAFESSEGLLAALHPPDPTLI